MQTRREGEPCGGGTGNRPPHPWRVVVSHRIAPHKRDRQWRLSACTTSQPHSAQPGHLHYHHHHHSPAVYPTGAVRSSSDSSRRPTCRRCSRACASRSPDPTTPSSPPMQGDALAQAPSPTQTFVPTIPSTPPPPGTAHSPRHLPPTPSQAPTAPPSPSPPRPTIPPTASSPMQASTAAFRKMAPSLAQGQTGAVSSRSTSQSRRWTRSSPGHRSTSSPSKSATSPGRLPPQHGRPRRQDRSHKGKDHLSGRPRPLPRPRPHTPIANISLSPIKIKNSTRTNGLVVDGRLNTHSNPNQSASSQRGLDSLFRKLITSKGAVLLRIGSPNAEIKAYGMSFKRILLDKEISLDGLDSLGGALTFLSASAPATSIPCAPQRSSIKNFTSLAETKSPASASAHRSSSQTPQKSQPGSATSAFVSRPTSTSSSQARQITMPPSVRLSCPTSLSSLAQTPSPSTATFSSHRKVTTVASPASPSSAICSKTDPSMSTSSAPKLRPEFPGWRPSSPRSASRRSSCTRHQLQAPRRRFSHPARRGRPLAPAPALRSSHAPQSAWPPAAHPFTLGRSLPGRRARRRPQRASCSCHSPGRHPYPRRFACPHARIRCSSPRQPALQPVRRRVLLRSHPSNRGQEKGNRAQRKPRRSSRTNARS